MWASFKQHHEDKDDTIPFSGEPHGEYVAP